MGIVVIMLECKIRHKDLQVLLARRVPEDMFFVYVLLLFFHEMIINLTGGPKISLAYFISIK